MFFISILSLSLTYLLIFGLQKITDKLKASNKGPDHISGVLRVPDTRGQGPGSRSLKITKECEMSSCEISEMMNNTINRFLFLATVIKESVAAKVIYLDIVVRILQQRPQQPHTVQASDLAKLKN